MSKKQNIKKDPLKLINWANDGYPPIDLNKQYSHVIALIQEVKNLRKQLILFSKITNHLEKCLDDMESTRQSGDCGFWEWDKTDLYPIGIKLLKSVNKNNEH